MYTTKRFHYGLCFGVLSAFYLSASATLTLRAQSENPRGHIILPPARGGTALSFQIQAEAEYLAARGDLAESIAVARKIHAEAFAKEIQNSVDYVDAYFQRRATEPEMAGRRRPESFGERRASSGSTQTTDRTAVSGRTQRQSHRRIELASGGVVGPDTRPALCRR